MILAGNPVSPHNLRAAIIYRKNSPVVAKFSPPFCLQYATSCNLFEKPALSLQVDRLCFLHFAPHCFA